MILFTLIFSVIYLFAISFLYLSGNKRFKNLLRLLAGIALLICINLITWQPVLKTEIIKDYDQTPILLIDNSSSMDQFNSQSSLDSLLSVLGDSLKYKTYAFGSQRYKTETNKISFNDTLSFFPANFINKHQNIPLILLSDGLFNYQTQIDNISKSTMSFYLPLKRIRHSNFIDLQVAPAIEIKSQKKVSFPVTLSGYSEKDNDEVTLKITNQKSLLLTDKIKTPSKNYIISPNIEIPPMPAGRHLIKTSLMRDNRILDTRETVIKVNPDIFKVFIEHEKPSLDYRFLKLAIQKRKDFKISSKKECDISIYFDGSQNSLTNDALINLVIGNSLKNPKTISLDNDFINLKSKTPLFMNFNSVGAPDKIFKSQISTQPIITSELRNKTISILSKRISNNKIQFYLNVNGFWRWDFTDNYLNNLNDNSFIDALLNTLKDNALKATSKMPTIHHCKSENFPMSELFTIYHPLTNPSANDSVFVFGKNKKGDKVLIRAKQLNTLLADDTLIVKDSSTSNFSYEFKLTYGKQEYIITKEIPTQKINKEISSNDQNTFLMDNFFQKINLKDTTFIKSLFKKQLNKKHTVTKFFKLQRNWILLIITIILLSIIWSIKEE